MKRITICFTLLILIAFGLSIKPKAGHSQQSQFPEYPPEFSPLRTSRPATSQGPLIPQTKFVKGQNPIPNQYIVVLNDDVVPDNASLEARRARITALANRHALPHGGRVDYVYETALKGYSIELPTEAAAIAISNLPQVKWVEEDQRGEFTQAPPSPQASPPWGLDAIDGSIPTAAPDTTGRTNGLYLFNANGSGVSAYVLDSGINTQHQAFLTPFFSRASEAADCFTFVNCQSGQMTPFFNQQACVFPMPNSSNNDCHGHGTHVAGIVGGNTYGVAKNVTIKSVKIGSTSGPILSAVIAGVNWVTSDHQANPSTPAVANMSLEGSTSIGIETAVQNSIAAGVTYVVAAGNSNVDARNVAPADVADALTVGAVDWNLNRWIVSSFQGSNWGPGVDLFAPGVFVVSALTGNFMPCAWNGTNTTECQDSGTSYAAPQVAGAVAMYLQGRPGVTGCNLFPIQGVAPASGNLSTCPDRVARFIKATANLNRLTTSINGTTTDSNGNPITVLSPNRLLWNIWIPTQPNPINNQRFFVWQHYADFLVNQPEPDEGGLNFWTSQITGNCGTGFNDNNSCTAGKRIDVSRAFWVAAFGSLFNSQGTTNNSQFVHLCYERYLRRSVPDNDPGFQFWLNDLTNYGNPANFDGVNHLIDAFINSFEYRRRFGPQ